MPVEDIVLEEHLALAPLERLEVEARQAQCHLALFDLADPLCGNEDLATGDTCEGAADRRVLVIAEPDEQVGRQGGRKRAPVRGEAQAGG